MRNLVWSSTALVVLIGAGFFISAQHAVRFPDSLAGRCVTAIYQMCDPLLTSGGQKQAKSKAASNRPAMVIVKAEATAEKGNVIAPTAVELADAVEPIIVAPTEQEPPLAFPMLSLELSAAIERLRGEEESETAPKAFDSPRLAKLHMPYADEETQVLPALTVNFGGEAFEMNLPGSRAFYFLPPTWWPEVFSKAMGATR
jgi:hypothetical protein